jgi:peroxiredoxin family protein
VHTNITKFVDTKLTLLNLPGQVPLGVNRANFRVKNTKLPLSGPKLSELGLTEKRKELIDDVKQKMARKQKVMEINRLKRLSKQDDKKLDKIELSNDIHQVDMSKLEDFRGALNLETSNGMKRESKLLKLFRVKRASQ